MSPRNWRRASTSRRIGDVATTVAVRSQRVRGEQADLAEEVAGRQRAHALASRKTSAVPETTTKNSCA